MRKLIYGLIILSLASLSTACKEVRKEYFPNGRVKSETEYRFGKENGKMVFFDEGNHRPTLEVTMKKGKKNGKLYRYFFNGTIESESYFVNDIQEGVETVYDLTGFKAVETHYENGKKNGPYHSWHEKDVLKEQGAFKDDMFDGEWLYYDTRGFLVGEGKFDQGTGEQHTYDSKGNLVKITNYANNLKNGPEIEFTPSGDTLRVIIFKDDRIEKMEQFKP